MVYKLISQAYTDGANKMKAENEMRLVRNENIIRKIWENIFPTLKSQGGYWSVQQVKWISNNKEKREGRKQNTLTAAFSRKRERARNVLQKEGVMWLSIEKGIKSQIAIWN